MEETIRGIFPFSAILCLLEYDTTKQVKRQKEKTSIQKTLSICYFPVVVSALGGLQMVIWRLPQLPALKGKLLCNTSISARR